MQTTSYPFWKYIKAFKGRYAIGLLALLGVDFINILMPLTIRDAIDALPGKNHTRLFWLGIFYFGLMAVQSVGRYLWRMYLIGSSHLIARNLRIELYEHLQRLPWGFYQNVRTGDLMSRATNDIESIRMAVGPGILISIDALLMFLFIVPVMFFLSVKLALLAFAFYPIVPFLTARLGDRIDALFESLQVRMSRMSAYAQESFAAVRLIKSLVLESRVSERFRQLSKGYKTEGFVLARYQAVFSPALSALTSLGTFLILLFGGLDVMEGALTVGTFVAFQRFVVQLSWPMEAIGWSVSMTKEGIAAERRLQQILSAPQVESTLRKLPALPDPASGSLFEIKRLHFRHRERDGGGFSLDLGGLNVERGQKVGLVGAVGAGKSTLFHLMLRLYEPPFESLFFKGADITAIPLNDLRTRIASVEQQIFLFSETIAANVSLGLNEPLSDKSLREISKIGCLYSEIMGLDKEFETPLGECGVNLSGGQKQRLALMRALARQPELLLLDDAFSAVDVEIENQIIENFFSQYPQMSLCFASHRLSVMPRMDEIWLIDQGKLLDRAPHIALLEKNSLYRSLWEKSEREIERAVIDDVFQVEELAK